jgi:hypothetical protein
MFSLIQSEHVFSPSYRNDLNTSLGFKDGGGVENWYKYFENLFGRIC